MVSKTGKQLLILVLAFMMIMTLVVGCGQKEAPNGQTSDQTDKTDANQETPGESSEQPSEEQGEFVRNEKTEEMVLFYPWANNSTTEGIEEVKAALEEAMKDTVNVKLNWIIIPRENFEEKLNTMLASGERLDGGVGDGDDFWAMNQRPGLVRPIDDLLEKYGKHLKEKIPQIAWDAAKNAKGEIAGIPSYSRYYWQGAVIRKDWLDELNLEVPDTLEELEAVLEAFKQKDPNIIPAGGQSWYLEPFLMSAVTGDVTPNFEWETLDPDGNITQSFCHPKYKEFLKLYHRWLDNGWFNKDFLVTTDEQNEQMFLSGKMGVLFIDPHNVERYNNILKQKDPNAEVTYLPVPSGPAGGPAFPLNNGVSRYVWITQSSPSPERVIQYFDWLVADQEHYTLAKLGIENKHYVKQGDKWVLPESAAGDPNKRAYYDVFAPLEYEFLNLERADASEILKEIDEYYASLPVVMPKLYGFTANWEEIEQEVGQVNFIDIWGEMYNIAVKARPLSDWEVVVEDYMKSGGDKVYPIMTRQYNEWKEKNNK